MKKVLSIITVGLVLAGHVLAGTAKDLIKASGVKGGLVVHIGCVDASLTTGLHAGDAYLVHGVDADAKNVAKAREYIKSKSLAGKVSVNGFDGKRLLYMDNLVNMVVVSGVGCQVSGEEILRVLAPGGIVVIKENENKKLISDIPYPASRIGNGFVKITKPVPSEIDEWTHFLHSPNNNAVANDSVVGPPKRFQWICGPAWARSHDHLSTTSAMVSSGGRIFYIFDEGNTLSVALPVKWKLIARDAYSGVLLWKRDIGPWEGHLRGFRSGPSEIARRLVSVGDRVYVTLGYGRPVEELDAATGKTLKTYKETDNALEFIVHDGVLLAVVGDRSPHNTDNAAIPAKPKSLWMHWPIHREIPPKKHIAAIDVGTGKTLWKKVNEDTVEIMPTTLAASGKKVFFHSSKEIISLEAGSGKEVWRTPREVSRRRPSWSAPTLLIRSGVVLCGDRGAASVHPGTNKNAEPGQWVVNSSGGIAPAGKITAFDAETGKKLWEAPGKEVYNAPIDVLVADGLVWSGNLVSSREQGITKGLDLRTGEAKRKRPNDQKFFKIVMGHHRCYRNKATEKYLVLGRDGIEFIDVASGKGFGNAWVRGACQYGVMPCNGLVYSPPHSCACHIETKLNSFNVMAAAPKGGAVKTEPGSRLEKGPAYSKTGSQGSEYSKQDWPTYRKDNARSGKSGAELSSKLKKAWTRDIGGRLSTVTVAGGKCFVASIDTHTVYALDSGTGKILWEYTAGGRVDSPPTIYKGMVLFGSADGWIYCLRDSDGALAWRFNAALLDRWIVSYGQVESVSPLHGSVLVQNGVLYAVAGRNSYLDAGMRIYRMDPVTGKVLSQKNVTAGALPDVLSSDGTNIFMRHSRYDKKLVGQAATVPHLYSPAGFLDGDWWHRTYWQFGKSMGSNYGGWPVSGKSVPSGRIMTVDDGAIYGYGRFNQYNHIGSHVGLGKMKYVLYASSRVAKKAPAGTKKAPPLWTQKIPVLARGMLLSGKTLFVAGPPDVFGTSPDGMTHPYNSAPPEALREQDELLAGKMGATLLAISAEDGKSTAEYKLDASPVWDGMVAAGQCLYIAGTDGKVVCLKD